MPLRTASVALLLGMAVCTLEAAAVSRQQADSLSKKLATIEQQGSTGRKPAAPRRTPLSEGELNSWFAYYAPALLPKGLAEPRVTIVDSRTLVGVAIVDLDAIAKSKASGRMFDVWNLIGGRVPVTVTGFLHADRGRMRFEMQSAEISGVPVPTRVVQDVVDYYSRTPDHPKGVRLDDEFTLPAGIQDIELSPGTAVVIQ